jgi:hypothetical protein
MANRGSKKPSAIYLEAAFDRLLLIKLQQVYEVLVPACVRAIAEPLKQKGDHHEDRGDLREGLLGQVEGGQHNSQPDGGATRLRPAARLQRSRRMGGRNEGYYSRNRTETRSSVRVSLLERSGSSLDCPEPQRETLARRLSESVNAAVRAPGVVRTVAVLPAGGSCASRRFVDLLREVFGSATRAVFLTEMEIAARLAGASLDDPATSRWLNSLETEADFIFYIADQTLTQWTEKCIRQADVILLVAVAGASAESNPSELFAFFIHPPSARRLVILHEARTKVVSGTTFWLGAREVFMHHHVALQDAADVRRLCRFLSGRAVGFVAGGGGALGSAHLGAYKAFCEAGADFDILGGTSVGAAMTAALACGKDAERADDGTRNIFVRSRAFRRPTLPRYGH